MRLIDVDLERARWAMAEQTGDFFGPLARAVIAQIEQLQQERATLASLPVPAAFTNRKPDTPEAQAARRQMAIIYGRDPENVGGVNHGSKKRRRKPRKPREGPGDRHPAGE